MRQERLERNRDYYKQVTDMQKNRPNDPVLAKKSGVIVDIASLAALAPTPGMTYYNASKAGLAAASEALRGELRGTGVHVVTVYPGIVATDMAEKGLAAYGSSIALRLQPKGTTAALAAIIFAIAFVATR